jgi:hypothetical protein
VCGRSHKVRKLKNFQKILPLVDQGFTREISYGRNSLRKRVIGYARVSTEGQTLDSQLEQLRAAGYSGRNIYREKVTGVRPDWCELNLMLKHLGPGDVVAVTRIDRLARSTFDLFGHRQAHRRRQGAISFPRGTVGRHRHRAVDAGGNRRAGRC